MLGQLRILRPSGYLKRQLALDATPTAFIIAIVDSTTAVHCSTVEKMNLKRHIESVHEGNNPFKCNICYASFSQKVRNHVKLEIRLFGMNFNSGFFSKGAVMCTVVRPAL